MRDIGVVIADFLFLFCSGVRLGYACLSFCEFPCIDTRFVLTDLPLEATAEPR